MGDGVSRGLRAPAPHRHRTGTTPAPHRHHTGTTPAPHRHHTGTTPAPHRHRTGTAPAPHRHRANSAQMERGKEKEWCPPGTSFKTIPHFQTPSLRIWRREGKSSYPQQFSCSSLGLPLSAAVLQLVLTCAPRAKRSQSRQRSQQSRSSGFLLHSALKSTPLSSQEKRGVVIRAKWTVYFAVFMAATCPWRARSTASASTRAASCGAWKPMLFSAAMKSRRHWA
jgi:hypothetical protein